MPRLPAGFHYPAAGRGGDKRAWRPGLHGTGMQRPRRPPVTIYRQRITGVPLTGGQATATVDANGRAIAQVGPQGLGTIWYPAQATISTTTGAADNATCAIYLGATNVANLQAGQSYAAGGDTVALSVPALTPGGLLIAVWTGGVTGDTATLNIIGTMDALTA